MVTCPSCETHNWGKYSVKGNPPFKYSVSTEYPPPLVFVDESPGHLSDLTWYLFFFAGWVVILRVMQICPRSAVLSAKWTKGCSKI
jgi:hypothetical protein